MLWIALAVYVTVAIMAGCLMVSLTHHPDNRAKVGIILLAFGWPLYLLFLMVMLVRGR